MRYIPISNISEIYECSQSCIMKWHWATHEKLHLFSLAIRKFERLLGEDKEEDLWQQFLRPLKRYRYRLCAVPLPFNHKDLAVAVDIDKLAGNLAKCQFIYPDLGEKAKELFEMAKELNSCNDKPLIDLLHNLSDGRFSNKTGLLLRDYRMIPSVRKMLSSYPALRKVELIKLSQLSGGNVYKKLIVIGPTRWFPSYVFEAPRAKEIHLVNFNWIKDYWKPEPIFLALDSPDDNTNPVQSSSETVTATKRRIIPLDEYVDAEEIYPTINWSDLSTRYAGASTNTFRPDVIQARLFLLDGDFAVFVDSAENARAHVINLDTDVDEEPYGKMLTSEIQPGMYILLRTGDRGDYIYEIADRIIGDEAHLVRETQKKWKHILWEQVSQKGTLDVSKALLYLGSPKANEVNVRNWVSERNIKPRDEKDFIAIMKLIGLEDKAKEYWDNAALLEKAHRRAGHKIAELLLKQVLKSDLSMLERTGTMDFQLPEVDGGILTAFRIEGIAPETVLINSSRIGRLIERDEFYG